MAPAPEPPPRRRVLREETVVLPREGRIDTVDYRAEYPPMSGERLEYVQLQSSEEGEPASSPGGLRVGAILDGYRIKRLVGRGGMSVVYEAEQVSLGRTVALKVMPPALMANARATDRFRREAAAVARLGHPRIVGVHGFNITEGLAYLAMEFVEGLDLAEIVDRLKTARTHGRRFVRISGPDLEQDITEWARGRKLMGTMPGDPRMAEGIVIDLRNPFPMMAALVADAADALRHAHAHGVIHRDVKPSNLILATAGRIKLSDFGLAKSSDTGSLTETGDFVGSPAYVSPEQASSGRERIDERSDVYSLGVTLYELLTLHQPFAGKNVAVVLKQILTRDPPPPTRLNPRIPRDLETIVLKAIEKDKERRYQSAEELGDDLRRFLNFEPIQARPLGPVARGLRFVRNHRVGVALSLMGGLIIALSVVLAGAVRGSNRSQAVLSDSLSVLFERLGHDEVGRTDVREFTRTLVAADSPERRRSTIEGLAQGAEQRLEAGAYDELARLLVVLDLVRTELQGWTELDRRMLETNVRQIKIVLVRRVRDMLGDPAEPVSAATFRGWLGTLERLLLDPDWQICENAAAALARIGDVSSLGALLDALGARDDRQGQVALLRALTVFGDASPRVAERIAEELADPDEWVRHAAVDALDRLDPPGLQTLLAPLSGEREQVVLTRADQLRTARLGGRR